MKRCRVLFLVLFALDIMVLSTDGVWTRWFNLPKEFQGDYETLDRILTAFPRLVCDDPSGIEVQTSEGMPAAETGEVFHQYDAHGFICLDNQQDDGICNDYRIRFCCPGKFGAETCHTEEEIANYTMAKNSSVSIRENTAVGSHVFNVEEWRLPSQNYSLHIVDGNTFNRFGISEDNSAIVVANPLEASITEEFALAIHVHMMSEHTRAFGLTVHVTAVNDWPPYYNKSCETPIKDERSWPHIADLSLDGKKASYDDPNIDLSKQLRYVTNNSHCALDIYFGLYDTSALFPRRGTSNNDEISWYETEGKVTFLDQSHDVEIVKLDGGNTAHFGFKIIEVKEGKPIQNRMVKEVSEYMGLKQVGKITLKMIDTHVRQRFDVDVRLATKGSLKRPFSFGIVEMIYVGCPLNKYGGSCEYDCMCQNGATCHAWNGACQCDEGWRGPVCDIPMDPSVTLMISSQEVFYYSPVRLMCNFINVSPAELFFELNEKLLTEEEKTLVISNSIPGLTQLKIKNMTSEFEGSYRCNVSSKDPSIYGISNSLEVSIEGCQVGMWGNVCQHRCDCVNYINCSRYHGCMCHTGWSGEKCDRDTKAPIIQCPLNITKFVRDFSTKVNISWPNVRSTDNAGPPAVSANFRSGDLFEIGTTIVIYKAVDSSNNSASCIFAVTVNGPAYMNDKVTISSIGLLTIIFIAIVTLALVILFKKRKGHNYMPLREPRLSLCIPDEVPVFDRKEIVVGNIIGQGEFSMVHSGTLTVGNEKRNVAVKILKDDIEYQTAYQNEVTTLTLLSQCPHIIPLIGVITNSKSDKKMIITELMCTDMHSELKKLQQQYDSSLESGRRLMKFCCHVALALQHMEKTKVLHRDIAARNVLISNTDIAKIGDFGLARDIYQTAVYQRPPSKKNCRVPVRWMAPESLTNSVYTSSSDIWAFGVFLWETATLGGMPYDNIDIDELVRRLQNGYRLKKPQHCDEEFYTLMRRCWKWNPRDRITATMAVEVLFKLSKHEKGVFHTEEGHVHQSVYL